MTESTQPELAGMPEPEPITPRWLHLCEESAVMFGYVALSLTAISQLPTLKPDDSTGLREAAVTFGCLVKQQIGARAWDTALEQAGTIWTAMYEQARAKTAAEGGAS